ncbi:uncharacterized protein B0I36DRAFT_366129 [Microdochium trichocladiopsis]|uniref:Extracellular membrane protein CFEM domain-containing protein n=1 Tax=Microdochium trichocladiopsis TaxID=1682393 RepID=A0A9P8Y151_9PEZI|nr:uncharacterized protein B0I36DRAFT_366129 [Microdochium trichocladiopsis]KAH7026585.1 hypothetical protein B0I36DRAFT_366129 [Microdochium trichocladiopsis]
MYQLGRTALSFGLLALFSVANASPDRAECLLARSDELAAMAACGDAAKLSLCLASVPKDATVSVVTQCFFDAGCSTEDTAIGAGLVLKQCEQGLEGAELRIRGLESMPYITDAPVLAARADSNFVPSIQCSTDTTITITTCTSVVNGAQTSRTCFPTPMVTQVCDSANVCMKDQKGIDICMVRRNMPTTDGLVITIFLLVVFVTGCGTMIFLCCKDSREQKRIRAQHEAAQIAKSNKMAAAASAPPPAAPAAHGQDPFTDPSAQH